MRSTKSISKLSTDAIPMPTRDPEYPVPATNIHRINKKKAKALTDFSGELLAGHVLRPVLALPATEDKRQDAFPVLGHRAILDNSPDPVVYTGPTPIQKRFGLRRVAHCLSGA